MKKYSSIARASSRRTASNPILVWALWIAGVGIILWWLLPRVVLLFVSLVWWPIDTTMVWVKESQSSFPTYLRDRADINRDIQQLRAELATTRGIDATIVKLEQENNQLRELLGAVPDERLLARVIARPDLLPYDVLLIDQGSIHGVVEGQPVFIGRDKVLGIVTRTFPDTALVTLISSPDMRATAYVYGPNIYTETEGMGNGIVRIRVPQGIVLEEGNVVVLPAVDSGVYGILGRVETAPTKPERYGYIWHEVPLQSLQYVSVGRQSIAPRTFDEAQAFVASTAKELFVVPVPIEALVTPETFATSSPTSTPSSTTTISTGLEN